MTERVRYDVAVIGSGFGGSVAALRLAEKGYHVVVLEAGRRFADGELPETSWRLPRFLWMPQLHWYGIQRIDALPGRDGAGGVLVLSGAGVGGGSLVYANTLYQPLAGFFDDPQWRDITDWRSELAPHYEQASRMLGVSPYPRETLADAAMRRVADRMGVGHTFHAAPVGVFLGEPGATLDVPDPYFGGVGPSRSPCRHCGACMTGCRFGAKNTLTKNYLYLAERAGVEVRALTTVTAVRPRAEGGYAVQTIRTGALRRERRTIEADQVVFAAGALGTQRLLHRMRRSGALPGISPLVGALTRTNSESILGASVPLRSARRRGIDVAEGVAITSSFHPDAETHIEPVRYGPGSNVMGLLQTLLTDGGPGRRRRWLATMLRHPASAARTVVLRRWSQRTVIALVMQALDNSVRLEDRRSVVGRRRLVAVAGHGAPNPSWIPAGNAAVRLLAEELGGIPGGSISEIFASPLTAHIIGGAVIAESAERGVVDPYHRLFGHAGLHVIDGAAVSANLGANPALTIAAQAERAVSLWPNRGEPDPRPPLGHRYQRLAPIPPGQPVVPAHAPAALVWMPPGRT